MFAQLSNKSKINPIQYTKIMLTSDTSRNEGKKKSKYASLFTICDYKMKKNSIRSFISQ